VAELGKGPVIKVADGRNASGLIANRKLLQLLLETAREKNIPHQLSLLTGGTTDATAISLVGEGVPSAVVAVPTRYIHSPVETLSLSDAVNAARLVVEASKKITREWYSANLEKQVIAKK
jgi:endoglucanase